MKHEWLPAVLEECLPDEQVSLVTIRGLPPGLLMNNPEHSLVHGSKMKTAKDIPPPEEEAERVAYRMENGELYIPSRAIYGTILNGGKGLKFGKVGAITAVSGLFKIRPLQIPLGTSEYEIFTTPAVIGKARILKSRPNIKEWEATFAVLLATGWGIAPEDIQKMLTIAGRRVGILDFRPAHRGDFGTFVIDNWEILPMKEEEARAEA